MSKTKLFLAVAMLGAFVASVAVSPLTQAADDDGTTTVDQSKKKKKRNNSGDSHGSNSGE